MTKKSLLFDTDEFKIDNELKKDSIEIKELKQEDKSAKEKPKYLWLDLKGNSHSYVSFISNLQGVSMTEYINSLIDADKERNTGAYAKFLEIEKIKNNI